MWVKVCGIQSVDQAIMVARTGVNALGLNFYPQSRRYVSLESSGKIVASLPEQVEPIGLFVNASRDEIVTVVSALGLRTVQLHGDESPEFVASLPVEKIIRVYRIDDESGCAGVAADLSRLETLGVVPWRCLVDAHTAGAYGGTGRQAPWELLRKEWSSAWPPLILAGGLHPDNVAEAVRATQPWGVDVASGVESAEGLKDPQLTAKFVQNAKVTS